MYNNTRFYCIHLFTSYTFFIHGTLLKNKLKKKLSKSHPLFDFDKILID